jgi:Bifunctional DNA primase/polymerase, N-terminal/Primase C terminal 1 (PriCT-1)
MSSNENLGTLVLPASPPFNSSELLSAALKYAERGWAVIPLHTPTNGTCSCKEPTCSSPGKHPRTRKGLKDASTDQRQIQRWWTIWPDANIGIVTGLSSSLLVVDLDDKQWKKGSKNFADLADVNGGVPDTMRIKTGTGYHLYFAHPGESIKNSAGLVSEGVDIRAEQGYVVAPPSLHANGTKYEVEVKGPLAEVPEWLLSVMTQHETTAEEPTQNKHNPYTDAPVVFEGQRNETLFKLASALRGQHAMQQEQILAILLEYNAAKCTPPLSEDEVLRICASVCKFEPELKAKKSAKRQEDNPLYWFPFNLREWFSDQYINMMNDRQTGWYIRLITFAWQNGGFLPADSRQLFKLAKASSWKSFEKESDLVLKRFEEVEVNGQLMLKHPKMANGYAETLAKWLQKVEAAEKSRAARLALSEAAKSSAVPKRLQ